MAKEKVSKMDRKNLLLLIGGGFFGLYLFLIFFEAMFFSNIFGPFTKIAGVSVSNKNKADAKKILEIAWSEYENKDFYIENKKFSTKDIVSRVDFDKAVDRAFDEQNAGLFGFKSLGNNNYRLSIELNDSVSRFLLAEYDKKQIAPVDAEIILGIKSEVVPEKKGQNLLLAESKESITRSLSLMQKEADLAIEENDPGIKRDDITLVVDEATDVIARDLFVLGKGSQTTISKNDLKKWLKIKRKNPNSLVVSENFLPFENKFVYFDSSKIADWVSGYAKKVNQTEKNAKLGAKEDKVVVLESSVDGYKLDELDLINQLVLYDGKNQNISAKIETKKPAVRDDNLNELGITQHISTGWSDFTGSPANRIHNFTVGASRFNGVLIKPDERFSFNDTLGPVDASTGYLPELVIKENKTVPEYGGGMCQVSSTAFRAALNAGLPIMERTPHAYPVSYYKPYGVDATIYLPKPDLVFKNDTGHYILIQTKIEGKKIFFDFYGTKAPRTIKFSGNEKAVGAVDAVEKITPTIYDQDVRGPKSFTALFYRHIYDLSGKLTDNDKFVSKYDSPDKYPH